MELYATQYGVLMELLAIFGGAAGGDCGHRHHQPAGDHHPLGPRNRQAGLQRHCLAVPPHRGLLRGAEIRPAGGGDPPAPPAWWWTPIFRHQIRWILDHVPEAARLAREGRLLFGTVDTWLIWKLTGGRVHATDYTNASRTMLFDVEKLQWDEGLCRQLGIPMEILPQVRPSSGEFGTALVQGVQIPITGVAGDQQAALYGQCCFESGMAKNTYGTGSAFY